MSKPKTKKYAEYEPLLSELVPLINTDGNDDLIATALSRRLRKYGNGDMAIAFSAYFLFCLTDSAKALRKRLMTMVKRRTKNPAVIKSIQETLSVNITERQGRTLEDIPLYIWTQQEDDNETIRFSKAVSNWQELMALIDSVAHESSDS